MIKRRFFWWEYLTGKARWDTGITPPEIVDLIEQEKLQPGRALDLGCGTGTNVIYLARHNWQAVGIDYVKTPICAARRKARKASVADKTTLIHANVLDLPDLNLGLFDLVMDIGCLHSLPKSELKEYATAISRSTEPGGLFMLYSFRPTPQNQRGIAPQILESLFLPAFSLTWSNLGKDTASSSGSAWYRFERTGTIR
nr:class I SAM-dependent methyltransferase [Anaerolineae bacterium]